MVLETGNRIGGNAVRSNGYLAFVEDQPEAFVDDAFRAYALAAKRYGLVWDATAVHQFAAESADTHRILPGGVCGSAAWCRDRSTASSASTRSRTPRCSQGPTPTTSPIPR